MFNDASPKYLKLISCGFCTEIDSGCLQSLLELKGSSLLLAGKGFFKLRPVHAKTEDRLGVSKKYIWYIKKTSIKEGPTISPHLEMPFHIQAEILAKDQSPQPLRARAGL